MVPTLKVPKDALRSNGFINGYIKDLGQESNHSESIYLLFKPNDLDKFREFLDSEYDRTRSIIEDYDYPNGYVVVVYQLDRNFTNDFKLITEGKYSKTSLDFQKIFPKVIKITKNGSYRDEISLQYRIFNKSKDLKEFWEEKLGIDFKSVVGEEFEVWDGFDKSNEILQLNKLKKYV